MHEPIEEWKKGYQAIPIPEALQEIVQREIERSQSSRVNPACPDPERIKATKTE